MRSPLRIRWLLNALEEQTLERAAWDVIVAHGEADAAELGRLRGQPLLADGTAALLRVDGAPRAETELRDVAWRRARGSLVVFTRETCRPDPNWLAALLRASEAAPDAVVQGATRPDPDEIHLMDGPRVATRSIEPGSPWGVHTSIAYPRVLLEELGGLDLAFDGASAETDLFLRARGTGAPIVPEGDAITFHAVEIRHLRSGIKDASAAACLPRLARRHPEVRTFGWAPGILRASHAGVLTACAGGVATALVHPAGALLVLPWVARAARPRRSGARGVAEAALRLPGTLVVDAFEVAAMAFGSLAARRVYL